MSTITQLNSVTEYNQLRGVKTLHPLVTMLDLSKAVPMPAQNFFFGLYAIYLKELECGELTYGRSKYDYQEGTLVFIAPGQVLGIQPKVKTFQPKGWALLFDPELIRGKSLANEMRCSYLSIQSSNKANSSTISFSFSVMLILILNIIKAKI